MAENGVTVKNPAILSHKRRKALLKKEKRKLKRQSEAKNRDEQLKKAEELKKNSPSYVAKIQQEVEEEKIQILRMEAESQRQRELWEWHEEMYKQRLKQKEEQEEMERLQRLELEKKIKEEWEERQKKEKEEEEERRQKKEKQVTSQIQWSTCWIYIDYGRCYTADSTDELLRQARDAENKDGDWSNPLAPVQYGKERQIETCPFFAKVAACRFGERCSRAHPYPDSSRTLLFTNMFRHFQLDQGLCEEYDTDIVLEYEDSEVYQKFKEFYEDTLPEFKVIGHVVQFKVCCNFQPHLRGNVYVSYSREDHTAEAFAKFNARWYGGKQISAQFVDIPSWKRAICGLFGKGRCPKGRECNFLHVFNNPSNEFNRADRDLESFSPHQRNNHDYRQQRSRDRYSSRLSRSSKRSRSRSHGRESSYRSSSRRYSRQKSRTPEYMSSRSHRYRSRSPENSSQKSRNRSRTPENRSRSSKQRSRSPSDKNNRTKQSRTSRKRRHRSRSYSSDDENREDTKDKKHKKKSSNSDKINSNSATVDNIESYEKSVNDSEEVIWVEKTIDTIQDKPSSKKHYRSRSSSEDSDLDIDKSDSDH